ncbi:MAG: hypothetical protein M0009_05185 [Deltaproteobacteria bacterium]|nr:hypothetical protein [Deltaproteobacteria bacterium]
MKKTVFLCLLLVLYLGAAACTASFKNYGRFVLSDEAGRAFDQYRVNEELRYYISGPDLFPNALLGLHRSYRLSPGALWREVAMDPRRMQEIIEHMKTQAFRFGLFPNSYVLVDNRDRPVGVWYSIREAQTHLLTEADGTLSIPTPPVDTFLRKEEKWPD